MYKTKYVLLHHDQVVMQADSCADFARVYFKVEVFRRDDGGIGIRVLGREVPQSYVSIENDPRPMHGWTPEEAERDYIANNFDPQRFNKHWANYAIYKLCE